MCAPLRDLSVLHVLFLYYALLEYVYWKHMCCVTPHMPNVILGIVTLILELPAFRL